MRKTTKRKFAPVAKTKKGVPKKYVAGAKNPKAREKEILGFYLSGNPLEEHLDALTNFTNIGIINSDQMKFNKLYFD